MILLIDKRDAFEGSHTTQITLENYGIVTSRVSHSFTVKIDGSTSGPYGEFSGEFANETESEEEYVPPDLFIKEIDKRGTVNIKFTKLMQVPDSVEVIDDSVFDINVNAVDTERQPLLAFAWETIEFTPEYCIIQLTFEDPLQVSSEIGPRDFLQLTVLKSKRLYEQFDGGFRWEKIAVGTQRQMDIPPQGLYSETFSIVDDSAETIENTVVLVISGNSVLSVLLAGGLSAVWGLINSLQIVAHLPLLNVQMPANATIMYDLIYQIATFDLPFVGDATNWFKEKMKPFISDQEKDIEIADGKSERRRNLLEMSSNAKEYGYTSTNPLVNSAFAIMLIGLILIVLLLVTCLRLLFRNKYVKMLYVKVK